MTITALPTPPSRQDPTNFASRADAFLLQLPVFASEANALATEVEGYKNTTTASQTAAAGSATAAAGSATAASASQTAAAGSATAASTSATAAAGSATAASSSAAAAAASYDAFDDRHLGAKATNPTLDNDGNALQEGAIYWNTVFKEIRIYTGTTWQNAAIVGGTVSTLAISGPLTETVQILSGTSINLSPATGMIKYWDITANSTITISLNDGQSVSLMVTNGTSKTITWNITVKWFSPTGAAPTISSIGTHMMEFWSIGGVIYGMYVGAAV